MTLPGTQPATATPLRSQARASDVVEVRGLVEATGMFSTEEIAIAAELVREGLERGVASGYHFVFADRDGRLEGYCCYGPIPATRESFDLYWIAVHPRSQGGGLGRRLLAASESAVYRAGGRRLYVDTAGRAQYAPTRGFYERAGYRREATLADFYAPGDDKVVYVKRLGGPARTGRTLP